MHVTRGSRLATVSGVGILLLGLVGLGFALAGQGLTRADSWSSVISGFVGLVGLAVTVAALPRPARRETLVLRRTAWGRRRLPADLHRLLRAQAGAAESLPYQVPGAGGARLSTIYVRQQVEATGPPDQEPPAPGRDGGRDAQPRRPRRTALRPAAQPIERVLGRHRHLIVEGGPGLGKSTLARDVTLELARAWLDGGPSPVDEEVVPLLVSAQALSHHRDGSWAEALSAAAAEFGQHADGPVAVDPARDDIGGASWLIIVDGLDEVPEPHRLRLVDVLAERMARPGGRTRLMILSRPLPEGSRQRLRVAGCGAYTIMPFTRAALLEFVGKAVVARRGRPEEDLAARFVEELRRVELDDVATTPLLATVALAVYLDDPGQRLPGSRRALYERYLEYLNDRGRPRRPRRRRLAGVPGGAAAAAALHDRRRELLEHLAVRRVAGDEPLGAVADQWCRAAGIAPAEPTAAWGETIRDTLEGTGVMFRHGNDLRFLHHSFAEHIAAAHEAAALPATFDPGSPDWSGPVRQAVAGEGIAAAVLAHWAGTHPAGGLLTWLQGGSGTFQALALSLIGEGAAAEPEHVRAGLRYVESTAWWQPGNHGELLRLLRGVPRDAETRAWALARVRDADDYPALQAAAARLLADSPREERDAAADHLLRRLDGDLPTHSWAAMARAVATLAPGRTVEVATALLAALDRPDAWAGAIARELADLGPEHAAAVIGRLAARLGDGDLAAAERIDLAEVLSELDESRADISIAALRAVLGDETASLADRRSAARALLEAGPGEPRDAVSWLHDLVAAPGEDPWAAISAAALLIEYDPADRQFATTALRDLAEAPQLIPWHRIRAADTLMELGVDADGTATRALLAVLADPRADAWDLGEAAAGLSKLGESIRATAIAQVRAALAAPGAERPVLAVALARLAPDAADEVAEALRRAAAHPAVPGRDLGEIARTLAGLGPGHRREACVALLNAARLRLDGYDAGNVVLALAELYPESLDEAAEICQSIAADPGRTDHERANAVRVLTHLGPAYRRPADDLFAALLAETSAVPADTVSVIQMMYDLAPGHRAAAVAELTGLLTAGGLDSGERVLLAVEVSRLSPDHRAEMASTLAGAASDPYAGLSSRVSAAEWLIQAGAEHRSDAVGALWAALREPDASGWQLARAAELLSRLGEPGRAEAIGLITGQLARAGPEDRRIALAIALGGLPGQRGRASEVLGQVVADPAAGPAGRIEAAEKLIDWGTDRATALAGLRDVVGDPRAEDWDLQRAAEALAVSGGEARAAAVQALERRLAERPADAWLTLGPALIKLAPAAHATVAARFGALLDDPYERLDRRLEAGRWLATTAHRDAAIARLRALLGDDSLRAEDRLEVARCLAGLSPPDHATAAAVMRALLGDPWLAASGRIDGAEWLSRLPADREAATAVLRDLLTSPGTGTYDAIRAARLLGRRDPGARLAVIGELQARADDPYTDAADRYQLACAMAKISVGSRPAAAEVMLALLGDPATDSGTLASAAEWLAGQPRHRLAAAAVLDRLLADPDLPLGERSGAAVAYAKLLRPPESEGQERAERATTPAERLVAAGALAADPARAVAILDAVAGDPAATLGERWHAITRLTELPSGGPRAADRLRELLDADELTDVERYRVAGHLAGYGGAHRLAARSVLRAALSAEVRPGRVVDLAEALGETGREDREPAVTRLLRVLASAPAERERAYALLTRLGAREPATRELRALRQIHRNDVGLARLTPGDGGLSRILGDPAAPPALRCEAAVALAEIRSADRVEALSALRRLCEEPDIPGYVRVRAGRALLTAGGDCGRAGSAALAATAADDSADPTDRLAAATALRGHPPAGSAALAVIVELTGDGVRPGVRLDAAWMLSVAGPGHLGTGAAALRAVHDDARAPLAVRLRAAAFLAALGPARRHEGAALLRTAAGSGDPRACLLAAALLTSFPPGDREHGVELLERLADDPGSPPRIGGAARRILSRFDRLIGRTVSEGHFTD